MYDALLLMPIRCSSLVLFQSSIFQFMLLSGKTSIDFIENSKPDMFVCIIWLISKLIGTPVLLVLLRVGVFVDMDGCEVGMGKLGVDGSNIAAVSGVVKVSEAMEVDGITGVTVTMLVGGSWGASVKSKRSLNNAKTAIMVPIMPANAAILLISRMFVLVVLL
jgi:hypothetical protein